MQVATYRDDAARARAYGAVAADWAHQVHAFRRSVACFQRVIQRQARRRDAEHQPAGLASRRSEAAPRLPASNDRMTSSGVAGLTPRQVEVAALIADGLTNRQIAAELVLTKGTVANHVEHILNKLSCHSRAQIAVWAVRQGLAAGRAS